MAEVVGGRLPGQGPPPAPGLDLGDRMLILGPARWWGLGKRAFSQRLLLNPPDLCRPRASPRRPESEVQLPARYSACKDGLVSSSVA